MRIVAIPILIALVMTQTFNNWFVVLSFNLNRDYIAKNLCENRFRPALQCKGNCVLMKRMKEEEKKEQNSPANLKLEIQVLSSRSFFASLSNSPVEQKNSYYTFPHSEKPVDRSFAFFHPPAA